MSRKALGRGLEALIPGREKESEKGRQPSGNVTEISIDRISPSRYQPRKKFDEHKLEELVASVRTKGVIQPVVVRPAEEGYELIAGERRFQAAKRLGMSHIPAIVKKVADKEMIEMSLVENLQRDDLNALEEALSYRQLMEKFSLTQEKLADEVGKNRASVANTLRLLKLPKEVQEELLRGRISRGHALALLSLRNADEQVKLFRRILQQRLSVRQTEVLAKREVTADRTRKPVVQRTPEFVAVEEKLQSFLGTRVNLKKHKKGGRIEISYYSDEDLGRILDLLGIRTE